MKNIKSIIFLLAITFVSQTMIAQVDRSKQPEPAPAPEFKIKEHKTFTLDNGLKVIVVENNKIPKISYQLIIDANPVWQKDAVGFVSLTGELLKSGTQNRSKAEIDSEIDFIGAKIHTSKNSVFGYTLSKHKETFLDIYSDILLNPVFPGEEIEKVKKQMISGLASSKTDPKEIATKIGKKLRNTNHPYSEIITEESVSNITRDLLNDYYNTYYKPNSSYLVIVGDIGLKEAKKDAEKYFGSWKESKVPSNKYQFPNKNIGTRVAIVHKEDAVQSYINITYPINLKTGDKDAIAASLANNILGGGSFSSRLLTNLREDKGYTYGAYSSIVKDPNVGYFTAFAQVGTEVTKDAVNQFIIEMNRMKNEPVSDETFSLFKNIQTGIFSRALEKPETIAMFAYNTIRYNLPHDYYARYLENMESLTKNEIQEVSKKYIDPNQAIIVVVGDKNKILDSLKRFSSSGKVEVYDVNGNVVKDEKKALPAGVDAKKVIDSYINAIGGKENIEKVKDITINATTEMNGMEISQKIYKKAPGMFAMIMSMNGNVMMQQLFDGEKAVMKGFQGEQVITGDEFENLKIDASINPELSYEKLGVKPELEAVEKVNDKDCYKVKIVYPTGKIMYDFFDIESGLKILSKQTIAAQGNEFVQKQIYSNYKELDGVKFPFSVKIEGMQNMELIIKSIKINTDLSNDLFQ